MMIERTDQIEKLVEEISEKVDGELDLFMIGGGAMMFLGVKEMTKDLDIVVKNDTDYGILIDVIRDIGFITDRPRPGMEKVNISDTFVRDEYRVDVFNSLICGKLRLSDGMVSRSVERIRKGKVSMRICSPEDVFLLKSLTEREGDYRDGVAILRTVAGFRWDIITDEMKNQMDEKSVWITYSAARLESINNDGFKIPIMNEVLEMSSHFMESWSKKYEDK